VAAVGPVGLLVAVSLGSVSLSLMRKETANNLNTPNHSSLTSHNSFNSKYSLGSPLTMNLESAFSVAVTDLYVAVDMGLNTMADIKLRSFIVLDCRPASGK
jgi:hypothetical protein